MNRRTLFLGCLVLIGVVAYLYTKGGVGSLAYLVLLLCPLMHIFMMRGHGGHGHHGETGQAPSETKPEEK